MSAVAGIAPLPPLQIDPIAEARPILPSEQVSPTETASGAIPTAGFGDVLSQMVGDASRADQIASQKVADVANGASDDLHGTMITMKEAEISLKLVGSIRTKLLDAFHELWRTSV